MNILIIRLSAMGDVAMTSPIVHEACLQNPAHRFTFLSADFLEHFFAPHPNFTFLGTQIRKQGKGIAAIWKLYREISSKDNFDVVVDLHDVLRTKILRLLFQFAGKKVVVLSKGRSEKRALTRKDRKTLRMLESTPQRYASALQKAGITLLNPRRHPFAPQPLLENVASFCGQKQGQWIGIAPFAQHKGKIYPPERMEQVVKSLSQTPHLRIFLFGGGAHERAVTESLALRYPNCTSVVGQLNLKEELNLIPHLDCMVSMDSAAMHMASLSGVRVVSIWGATHPFAGFMGYRQELANAVQRDLACRPCSVYGNKPCYKGTYECFEIDPETIVNKILHP